MSDGEPDVEEQVRRRAYKLWEQAGCPNGRGDEFWHEALADITSSREQNASSATAVPVSTAREPTLDEPPKPTT
ncbi:DUF2934 domain-containing protein (plasmid) [Lichenicola cladoniae]|uniref:DUF2934 domain-containing protein n=1 Tax=Lichenicola cladoniae TaxID=1484109 RepID=A0A6M8HXF9_9PROT|nr:DUF2934 domain-containing protein [Lichenicola cladoniae]NPD69818.1 DUF2934 domain-containing protein [Acetobacteraceae bacterium]QKE93234.1 DUF2934 domain-containing protein [Lichenicola cladoniae]